MKRLSLNQSVQPARKKTHQWKLVCAHWYIALMWGKHFLSSHSHYCFLLIAGKYYTSFMLCLWTVDCHIPNSNQLIAVHQHSDQSQSHQWLSQITTKLPQELNSRLFLIQSTSKLQMFPLDVVESNLASPNIKYSRSSPNMPSVFLSKQENTL